MSASTDSTPTTALCRYTTDAVFYREKNLVDELLVPNSNFVAVMIRHILGRDIQANELSIMNAVLICLMEHGLTPSAIATRSIYMSAPENLQGAVAAGLMGVGSQFIGTMENCADLLRQLVSIESAAQREQMALNIVHEHRNAGKHLPGFGHHLHYPDDPRALKLLALGELENLAGKHVASLRLLSKKVDEVYGRHLTINATGATAALLGEINIPPELMRGFAVIARAAGLVAHVAEEQSRPTGRYIWKLVSEKIKYKP